MESSLPLSQPPAHTPIRSAPYFLMAQSACSSSCPRAAATILKRWVSGYREEAGAGSGQETVAAQNSLSPYFVRTGRIAELSAEET